VSFLLDTDICSAYLKGDSRTFGRFVQYGGRLHISVITAAELTVWASRALASSQRREAILALIQDLTVLDVDRRVARVFGEVRAEQLDRGELTPDFDLMIAATAIVHGLTLVTHNVRDYAAIGQLSIVDWLAP